MTIRAREQFSRVVLPSLGEGYRLARWLTGSAADAEDVIQEACLRAYTGIETFAEGNARAWFLTIVRNTCYTWLQRNRATFVVSSEALSEDDRDKLEAGGEFANPAPTPENHLLLKEEADHLRQAIDALPFGLKEVLVLREYHELSYREIAEVSRVPIGTVMSRLSRARQMLMSALNGASGDGV